MHIETINHATRDIPGITSYIDGVHFTASQIGRQEVTIEGATEAAANIPVYAYLPDQEEFGLDPWRVVDGLDPIAGGEMIDLWFENGACKSINADDCEIRFFVDAKNINNEAAA